MPEPTRCLSLPLAVILLLLLSLAVVLRWDVYPATYFADELIPPAVVRHMLDTDSLDTNWANADWRGDFAGSFYDLQQYNFSSYHVLLLRCRQLIDAVGFAAVPDLVLFRVVSLLCQLACLLLVFGTGRRLLGNVGGVVAVALLVVMPQAVVDAHYARAESFVMLLVAVAMWLAWQIHVDRRRRWVLAEAAVWGVAFACKFSFLPMALLAFLAHGLLQRRLPVLLLWLAGFVAGVALSAPYILLDPAGFLHGVKLLLGQYSPQSSDAGFFTQLFPSAHQLFPYLLVFTGLPVLLLLFVPLFAAEKKVRFLAWICLPVVLCYVALFARQGVFFERNLSHLLPLCALLFAAACIELSNRIAAPVVLRLLLLLLCLAWPLYLSIRIADVFFHNLSAVRATVTAQEQALLVRWPGSRVVPLPIMAVEPTLEKLADTDLLRVPQHKLAGLAQVNALLAAKSCQQVETMELPLSFLPYNQLQINHFPPAYAYYRCRQDHAGTR